MNQHRLRHRVPKRYVLSAVRLLFIVFLSAEISLAGEFTSSLKLKVFVRGSSDVPDQVIGFTPVQKGHHIRIPEGKIWYVRPIGPLNGSQLDKLVLLMKNQNVPGLDLSDHWELSNESLRHLHSLTHLRMLDISQTRISDAGIPSLTSHMQLAILSLPGAVTDHALLDLKNLPGLRELRLDRTHIDDEGLTTLVDMPTLEKLDLSDTVISDKGISLLRKLPHLTRLILGGMITDACAPALESLKSLEEIDISQTQIIGKGLGAIASLPKLKTIYVNHLLSDDGLKELTKSRSLRALDLSRTSITDNGIKHLSRMKRLEEVALSQTAVGNECLSSLAELPELRMLDLNETQVTSAGLSPLVRLKKLEVLSLSWQKLTRDDLLEMSKLKHLKTIVLNGIPLPEATMVQLRQFGAPSPWDSMPGLERARLSQTPGADASVLAAPVLIPSTLPHSVSERSNTRTSSIPHSPTMTGPTPTVKQAALFDSREFKAPNVKQRPEPIEAGNTRATPVPVSPTLTDRTPSSKKTAILDSKEFQASNVKPNPEAIAESDPMSKSTTHDEDNLLRVIALQSNPVHAGTFSGLSDMRQLRQTQTMAALNSVTSAPAVPVIPPEEDKPQSSLGEISVGVHPSH